ncbi:putative beta-lysine N-acetyltransferase [Desulfofundulus thermobenzoicus]|uniref:putative beta-lysine N-acetyltransferase n=1 Tax=Desulfofundulus thermobenzoicus TaxID=29376 RepID=UPI00311AAD24
MFELINCHVPGFSLSARLEETSQRIWVTDYQASDPALFRGFLWDLARLKGMGKIVLPVRKEDSVRIQGDGFIEEGVINGYFGGADAHFLAAFPRLKRGVSLSVARERKMLREIIEKPRNRRCQLPSGFNMRLAANKDILPMASLFRQVFRSYPTPVYDPHYLFHSMERGDLFMVVYQSRNRLAGVAAAEIQPRDGRAELTNCATLPEYRGMGLNTLLLAEIEKICLARGILCLYSLARASSYGMNLVLHRLGYVFRGTLINNCHIGGRFENMNIWVKPAKEERMFSCGVL